MKYFKSSITLICIALIIQSCTMTVTDDSEKSTDNCTKLLETFTEEELEGLYLQEELESSETFISLQRDSLVQDTVGGKVIFNNIPDMTSAHRGWQRRVANSSSNGNGRQVLLTNSHAYGIKTLKEMIAEIDYYNANAVANGVDSITGIRIAQYIKRQSGQNEDYMDAYLVPVNYYGVSIPRYTDKTKANQEVTLTYNISNPCPDQCN